MNKNMPLISVIMGVYNDADSLETSLDSIEGQTYKNWEFIICNDCSNDNSKEILLKHAKRNSRYTIIENNINQGLATSLNKCLAMAKGKYIARMDADDKSFRDRLKIEVNYLEKHKEIDMVGAAAQIITDNERMGIRRMPNEVTKLSFIKGNPFIHPTVMIRKQILDEFHGYDVHNRRSEDLELWFRMFARGKKGVNLSLPLLDYHESLDDYKKRTLKAAIEASKVYLKGYKELKLPKIYYWYSLRPIVSAILPNKIMFKYHRKSYKK